MKNIIKSVVSLAVVLTWGTVALSAQSCAAVTHVSKAAGHSAAASGEIVAAGVESGAASVKVVSGVVAVPIFASGAVVASAGSLVASVGESAVAAGKTTAEGAEKLWDFATGDPAKRPAIDRTRAVPMPKPTAPSNPVDPSPAAAMKTKV
jgi:hypothetical protein